MQYYVEVSNLYFAERKLVNTREEADEWVKELLHKSVFRHGLSFDKSQWRVSVRQISG